MQPAFGAAFQRLRNLNFRRTVAGQEIDGKAILAFAPEGLRCSIEAPFTEKLGARI